MQTSGLRYLPPGKEIVVAINDGDFTNPEEVKRAFLGACVKALTDFDKQELTMECIVYSVVMDFFGDCAMTPGGVPVTVTELPDSILVS